MAKIVDYEICGRPIVDWDCDRSGRLFAKIRTCENSLEKTIESLNNQFNALPEDGIKGMKKSDVKHFAFSGSEDFTPITQAEHDYAMERVAMIAGQVINVFGKPSAVNIELPLTPPNGNGITFFVMS